MQFEIISNWLIFASCLKIVFDLLKNKTMHIVVRRCFKSVQVLYLFNAQMLASLPREVLFVAIELITVMYFSDLFDLFFISHLQVYLDHGFFVLALSLASSGREFDPRTRAFSDEELKPQPMIKKSRKQVLDLYKPIYVCHQLYSSS